MTLFQNVWLGFFWSQDVLLIFVVFGSGATHCFLVRLRKSRGDDVKSTSCINYLKYSNNYNKIINSCLWLFRLNLFNKYFCNWESYTKFVFAHILVLYFNFNNFSLSG
jgi:hypothetical protein